jgi:hypothetical protein
MISSKTLNEVRGLPSLSTQPLQWVMENESPPQGKNVLWLEFGVWEGRSINYISQFTKESVYGFDSFEGLPEFWRDGFNAGVFNLSGKLPRVNDNVKLVKGWFSDTLPQFLESHQDKKIGFVHLDADLYSSTKFVLSSIAPLLAKDAILVFDELINYKGFDGLNGELRAWDEFINEQKISYSWIGGHGAWGDYQCKNEKAAVRIHAIHE